MPSLQFSFPEVFYLFGAFHGIVLSLYLTFARKGHFANRFLATLLILFSFYLFENTMYSSGYLSRLPHLLFTTLPLIYLLAPLFYLYARFVISPTGRLTTLDLLHLVPFLFELAILVPLYVLPATIKVEIYQSMIHSSPEFQFTIYFFGYLVYVVSSLFYLFLTSRLFKGESKVNSWIKTASLIYFIYIGVSVILSFSMFMNVDFRNAAFHTNLFLQTFLIQSVGYLSFYSPGVFQNLKNGNGKKYLYSSLTSAAMESYKKDWERLMTLNEPFLDANLSPEYFERHMNISKHHLSQLMTEGLNSNFYDLVNAHRVEKAKKLLQRPEYQEAKILHIAFDSGFSNKSTFLRSFKKNTGLTPTEFRKKVNNLVAHD